MSRPVSLSPVTHTRRVLRLPTQIAIYQGRALSNAAAQLAVLVLVISGCIRCRIAQRRQFAYPFLRSRLKLVVSFCLFWFRSLE